MWIERKKEEEIASQNEREKEERNDTERLIKTERQINLKRR